MIVGSSRFSSYFLIQINLLEFDERKGEILGNPYLKFSRSQHTCGKVIIEDSDDSYRQKINEGDPIIIRIGFTLELEEEVLRGRISSIGRKLPSGTIIEFVDSGATAKSLAPAIVEVREGASSGVEQRDRVAREGNSELNLTTTEAQVSFETFDFDLEEQIKKYASLNEQIAPNYQQTLATFETNNLSFDNRSNIVVAKQGEIIFNEDDLKHSTREAGLVGETVTVEGDTITRISPDSASSTNISIDYKRDREVFVGSPYIAKSAPDRLVGATGAWTVRGWDINSKSVIGATVVIPEPLNYRIDDSIVILGTQVLLGDPIVSGNLFTWGDATKGGKRIPNSEAVVNNITAIARVIDRLNRQYSSQKWRINSWYRDPVSNRNAGGVSNSRHLVGDAVDVSFEGMDRVFAELEPVYVGGLAISKGSFIHFDNRGSKARWNY